MQRGYKLAPRWPATNIEDAAARRTWHRRLRHQGRQQRRHGRDVDARIGRASLARPAHIRPRPASGPSVTPLRATHDGRRPSRIPARPQSTTLLGDAGWERIIASIMTPVLASKPAAGLGFSERKIRLRWGGARIKDRYRWAAWKGKITITNAVINASNRAGSNTRRKAVARGATSVCFRSDTYGDADAIEWT